MDRSDDEERRLVVAARSGDHSAFRRIVDMYRARVFTFVLRVVKQYEEAEDIAQETFLRAWRYLARYNESRPFRSWLFAIARNLALNALRRPRAVIVSLDGEGHLAITAIEENYEGQPYTSARIKTQGLFDCYLLNCRLLAGHSRNVLGVCKRNASY